MDEQKRFWVDNPMAIEPCDPNVDPRDEVRLSGQNSLILTRLKEGPATNTELASISLKYTSRISDLRAAGYVIQCLRRQGGVNVYVLRSNAEAV